MIAHIIPKGDLVLENGTTKPIDGAEYARQRIECDLSLFLGEWFLDKREGIPYFRDVLIKNPNPAVVRSIFRSTILKVPGIVDVPTLDIVLDKSARRMTVTWEALYQDNTTVPGSLEQTL